MYDPNSNIQYATKLDSEFKPSNFWKIIHNVTLNYKGLILQVDHVIISRTLDIWLCSSNNPEIENAMSESQVITTTQQTLQNITRCQNILNKLILADNIRLPKKFGLAIQPTYHNLVILSPSTYNRILAVRHLVTKNIIPHNEVLRTLLNTFNSENPLKLIKLIAMPKLDTFIKQIKDKPN